MSSALSPVSAGLPPFFRSVSSSSVTVIASLPTISDTMPLSPNRSSSLPYSVTVSGSSAARAISGSVNRFVVRLN